jgi:hypothetical protein
MSKGWIGVDLDGTLAHYDEWKGHEHIGDPIPDMLERVKRWRAEGRDVRIFTARIAGSNPRVAAMGLCVILNSIQDWCEKHIGEKLPVTNVKDFSMIELWDDRAIQVHPNTGKRVDGK